MKFPNMRVKNVAVAVKAVGAACLGYYGLTNSMFFVEFGHCAVLHSRLVGTKDKVYSRGIHFKIPYFETPINYDVTPHLYQVHCSSPTRDHQLVKVGMYIYAHPDPDQLPTICRTFGKSPCKKYVPIITEQALPEVFQHYDSNELSMEDEKLNTETKKMWRESASDFGIVLDDATFFSISGRRRTVDAVKANPRVSGQKSAVAMTEK